MAANEDGTETTARWDRVGHLTSGPREDPQIRFRDTPEPEAEPEPCWAPEGEPQQGGSDRQLPTGVQTHGPGKPPPPPPDDFLSSESSEETLEIDQDQW